MKVFIAGKGRSPRRSAPTGEPHEAENPPVPKPAPHPDDDKSKNSLVLIPLDSLWSEAPNVPLLLEHSDDTTPEPLYRALFDGMYEGALITDISGIIADANTRAGELTGLHPLRLCGQPIANVIPGMDETMLHRISDHVQMGRFAVLEGWCQGKDGRRIRVEIAVSRIVRSRLHELLFSLRSQTQRVEDRDRDHVERRMLQCVRCGIALVDDGELIRYANPAFLRIWGHRDSKSVVGRPATHVWPADIASLFLTPLSTNAPWTGDISVTMPDGRIKSFQTEAVPCPASDGGTVAVLISFVEVTSLKPDMNAAGENS